MKRRALCLTLLTIVAFCGMFALWVQRERQQYARNRQLITALLRDDAKTAITLVNAGADPNTHQEALPAPTFKSLLNQLLHPSSSLVNDSPTAFLIACGEWTGSGFLPHSLPECVPLVQAMLAHGANINVSTHRQDTPLHLAALFGHLPTMSLLLAHGADANARDVHGRSPLLLAAYDGEAKTIRLLLAHGAKPNLADSYVRTPLYYAVKNSHSTRVVTELLAYGADPNLRTSFGDTPLRSARRRKRSDLVRLLRQHGAK